VGVARLSVMWGHKKDQDKTAETPQPLKDAVREARIEAAERPVGEPVAVQILRPTYLVGTVMLWLLFVLMLTISYCLNSWLPIMLVEAGFDESFAALSPARAASAWLPEPM